MRPQQIPFLLLAGCSLLGARAYAEEYYCYKDDAGGLHCGDAVPADHARYDRDVRNDQGIVVRFEEGEITEEEQRRITDQLRLEEERRRDVEERQRYDRYLLDSYLTVSDIERQRDRVLEQYDGQITVTEIYLSSLDNTRNKLLRDAERYAPHNQRDDAPPIPENLSLAIARAESSIRLYQQSLVQIRDDQESTRAKFQNDIARFRELKTD